MATVTRTFELSEEAIKNLTVLAEQRQTSVEHVIESLAAQPYFDLTDAQYRELDDAIADIEAKGPAPQAEVETFFRSVLGK